MMKNKDPYAGIILKLERLKQNKGQKEICHGICVPSYLSKIERNLVSPDENILQQLFNRLGIRYFCDKKFIKSAEGLINDYFEDLLYGIRGEVFHKLKAISTLLSYSPLAIDWLLVQGFEREESILPLLLELEEVMTDRQRALYYILKPLNKENGKEVLTLYKKAYGILNNSVSLLNLMKGYLILGEYDKVNEYADRCISLALEEGNTWSLAECVKTQGDVYASLNMDSLMLPFYERAIHLLQNTLWKEQLPVIYYNMGATYLQCGKYVVAAKYLEKAEKMDDKFLLNHKKALVKIRGGHKEEAKEFLEKMKNCILNKSNNDEENKVHKLMYEETLMEMEEGFLSNPDFIALLEKLISVVKEKKHPGFYLFYRDLLKEAYCKQRKYKKALELI